MQSRDVRLHMMMMNIHEAELFDSVRVEYCTFWGHVAEWLKFSKPSCNKEVHQDAKCEIRSKPTPGLPSHVAACLRHASGWLSGTVTF
jgi:hypothetical protein